MASDIMEISALSRPFILGMLYDARRDELVTGETLWDNKTIQENTIKTPQPSCEFEISSSDSNESKSSLMDVNASLKASYMSGLIDVGGSAKYLNDSKKFKNQSRVTFQYKVTTDFRQLSMIDLVTSNTQQTVISKRGWATHVVIGIHYGANAVFVFDSEKLDDSSVKDIQFRMEAVINKIPKFNIGGKVEIKLTDEEKALTDKFSCKFYGDFILESNPATFEDAVKTYVQLPKLLGQNGDNAVPLKVMLMPLKHFDPEAAVLAKDISDGLVRRAHGVLVELREIGMRCNESLVDRVVENFSPIQEELRSFQKLTSDYASKLKQALAEILPAIREGNEDESSAEELFEDRDKSPFSHKKLSKWLDDKEREINIIKSCVDTMGGVKIVKTQSELDREVLAPGVENALCFVFTSLESGDPYLDVMEAYLDSREIQSTNEDQWYLSDEVTTSMREKAKDFHRLAKALKRSSRFRFLITARANEKYKGATIYYYENGKLVTDGFSKPEIPKVEDIDDRKKLIWYACDLTLDPNTANNYLILSEGNKKASYGEWQRYPDHSERFDGRTQVLCHETLCQRHYWEVEWSDCSDDSVYIIAGFKRIKRKGRGSDCELGLNKISWAFGKRSDQDKLKALHNGLIWENHIPSTGCNRVGVFLDWPADTMSFYKATSNNLKHLYTFRTRFTDPLCPGFWASRSSNYAYLCPF